MNAALQATSVHTAQPHTILAHTHRGWVQAHTHTQAGYTHTHRQVPYTGWLHALVIHDSVTCGS